MDLPGHADGVGDSRSEVLILERPMDLLYGKGDEYMGEYVELDRSLPIPRMHNYTHYFGMP